MAILLSRNSKGQFIKGSSNPWNKGKKCPQISFSLKGRIPWNKYLKGWTKGTNAGFQKRNKLYTLRIRRKPTEIQREKMSKAHIGIQAKEKHPMWKGGLPKCSDCGKELSSYVNSQCKKCFLKGKIPKQNGVKSCLMQQNRHGSTSIEIKLYEELKNRGLLFETQKIINGRFIVDAYIPSLNLVIEADGNYWHSLPKVIGRDKSKNAYLKKCGFNLLRLTETEINNGLFINKLKRKIYA